MIGLETNVLVRYLAQDDLGQNNLGNGCEYTVTFDKKASASVGYQLLG